MPTRGIGVSDIVLMPAQRETFSSSVILARTALASSMALSAGCCAKPEKVNTADANTVTNFFMRDLFLQGVKYALFYRDAGYQKAPCATRRRVDKK